MPPETETKVLSIRQIQSFNATGQAVNSYIVQFTVGTQGPFTVTVPGDQFNAANVKAEMDKIAAEVKGLVGA